MGWFDEQLRYRKEQDNACYEDSLHGIADAVMGRRLSFGVLESAGSAIDDIVGYYHLKEKKTELPAGVKTMEDQLDYRLRPFGIMRRSVTLDEKWYDQAVGPMIGIIKETGSAVALIPGSFSGYSYIDPASGKRVRLNRQTEKLLDDEAICFYKPLPMKALKVRDLLIFMAQQLSTADLIMYVGMMALSALVGLLSPMFTKWLFGEVLESGNTGMLLGLAAYMLSYSICRMLMSAYQSLINSRVGTKQNMAVQAAVMNRVMSMPTTFFKQYASGELTQRASYVQTLCSTLMGTIGTTGLTSLFSLIYIGQVFAFAPALVVPSLIVTLTTVVITFATTFLQIRISREKMELSAKTGGMTYSMISGIQKIKLAGAEKRMFARWAGQYSKEASLEYNPPTLLKLSSTVSMLISLIGTLVMYALALKSGVSMSSYYAFDSAYAMVSGAFMSFAGIATSIASIRPILEMARPIMETEPEQSDGKEVVDSLRGGIELSHVTFKYTEDMPNVIDDLSMKIRPGEYVAIVGATGCGKSTLLRLMLGFEKAQKGTVYYDGKDIARLELSSLRKKIGTVMQDGKLFMGEIFANIVISAPQLTLKDAWEAAELASVAEDIRRMPMGMNTMISEGQGGISGGQKQRLMIARAIVGKPKILMFDEATSALDNVTQKKVSQAIDSLKCTRIVIAHRLSTIKHCDRIVVLDHGKIVEDGTYDELITNNGFFAELVARQRLEVEQEG